MFAAWERAATDTTAAVLSDLYGFARPLLAPKPQAGDRHLAPLTFPLCAKPLSEPQITLDVLGPLWHQIARGALGQSRKQDELVSGMPVHGCSGREILE